MPQNHILRVKGRPEKIALVTDHPLSADHYILVNAGKNDSPNASAAVRTVVNEMYEAVPFSEAPHELKHFYPPEQQVDLKPDSPDWPKFPEAYKRYLHNNGRTTIFAAPHPWRAELICVLTPLVTDATKATSSLSSIHLIKDHYTEVAFDYQIPAE
ncbi:hypothetical protein [Stenotrophomonas sp. GD03657]|uniref:hypothetical protein n=1 Tax=Stenotrophomonas sp. GD03657 TaxID=2975363 RepID=UPI00244A6E82|nr:hypothetical protein [Stenotrophomonas sp. GD03657]MDH2154067.1 hypothetical protein [Stenotrophomonas sp. GD03657]